VFSLNVEAWTIERLKELNTERCISSGMSTALTGTSPPLKALASTAMSGLIPK
jgi:hypothetical protein